jgi:hypothetical protein
LGIITTDAGTTTITTTCADASLCTDLRGLHQDEDAEVPNGPVHPFSATWSRNTAQGIDGAIIGPFYLDQDGCTDVTVSVSTNNKPIHIGSSSGSAGWSSNGMSKLAVSSSAGSTPSISYHVCASDIAGPLDCTSNAQCTSEHSANSECNSSTDECECKTGYVDTDASAGGLTCEHPLACSSNADCDPSIDANSFCAGSGFCECDADYTDTDASDFGLTCTHDLACASDGDCSPAIDTNSVCDSGDTGRCVCAEGFADQDASTTSLSCEALCSDDFSICSANVNASVPAVSVSSSLDKDTGNYVLVIESHMRISNGVSVDFPGSNVPGTCNYFDQNAASLPNWSRVVNGCNVTHTLYVPIGDIVSDCGFTQSNRGYNGSTLFVQEVTVTTNHTCSLERGGDAQEVIRSTEFPIELEIIDTVSASVVGMEVFGAAFTLSLLGDVTVAPNIDTNLATVSGVFVTETQHPYELHVDSVQVSAELNSSSFEISSETCTANNATRLPCQQEWQWSVDVNVPCNTKQSISGDQINITFRVNCSDSYIGECAPVFAVDPMLTFDLISPEYCPSLDAINLIGDVSTYARVDDVTSGAFNAADLGPLPSAEYESEQIFTIDSVVYGEFTTTVDGNAVSLIGTEIARIITHNNDASGQSDIMIYDSATSTVANTVVIYNTGFGSTYSEDYDKYHARFEFQWLDGVTVQLNDDVDASQDIEISVTAVSTFTNVESITDGSQASQQLLQEMISSDQSKSRSIEKRFRLQQNEADRAQSSSTSTRALLRRNNGAQSPSPSSDGSSFLSAVTSSSMAVVGVVAVAVVAILIVAVVVSKGRSNASHQTGKGLVHTSSSMSDLNQIQLSSMPLHLESDEVPPTLTT